MFLNARQLAAALQSRGFRMADVSTLKSSKRLHRRMPGFGIRYLTDILRQEPKA
jgi:hypothetical protein